MVAESTSEDRSSHHEHVMALDDENLPSRQENSPSTGEPVTRTTEVSTSGAESSPELPLSTPSTTGSTQVPPPAIESAPENVPKRSIDLDDSANSSYHLKWIPWNSGMVPMVMQSMNGPCPLIAIMNVLLLREKVKLPNMLEQITESQLLAYIGESIMDSIPPEAQNDENILLNLEQNIHDAIEILPRLKSGLDVNIRFTGITDFEYTPECIIFDLLRIPLYHGWLCDPGLNELHQAISNQSYNQLVDNIITNKTSQDPIVSTRVLLAEEFLERTASQLTAHGLNELKSKIKDNEIGILFRNNHFLTLFKREGEIYTLVTDHGYLTEANIVWETLDSVEGAGRFFDCNFQLSAITNRQVTELKAIDQRQQQMVNDYLVALSLNREENNDAASTNEEYTKQLALDDLEVARKLQAEEDAIYAEEMRKRQETPDRRESKNSARVGSQDVTSRDSTMSNREMQHEVPANSNVPECMTERISNVPMQSGHQPIDQVPQVSRVDQPGTVGPSHSSYPQAQQPPSHSSNLDSTMIGSENQHTRQGRNNRHRSEKKETNCVVH